MRVTGLWSLLSRPWFTVCVSLIQLIIFIIAFFSYEKSDVSLYSTRKDNEVRPSFVSVSRYPMETGHLRCDLSMTQS